MLRVLAGAVFVAAGIAVFLLGNIELGQVQFALLAVLATLVGVAVLTVPWWLRLVRDLGEERRERIVEAERAEIAAHLHDSVLQTLALIQRQNDQPREVLRLARGQERELRHWLYGPAGYGRSAPPRASRPWTPGWPTRSPRPRPRSRTPTRSTCARSSSATRTLDDGLRALVLAAREAMVNAAKHAEVDEISVYVEAEPTEVHVFVRDRGVGFDPDAVPDDRHGLADSVHGRMDRHGGTRPAAQHPRRGHRGAPGHAGAPAARRPRGTGGGPCSDERQPATDADPGVPGRRPRAVPVRGARRAGARGAPT